MENKNLEEYTDILIQQLRRKVMSENSQEEILDQFINWLQSTFGFVVQDTPEQEESYSDEVQEVYQIYRNILQSHAIDFIQQISSAPGQQFNPLNPEHPISEIINQFYQISRELISTGQTNDQLVKSLLAKISQPEISISSLPFISLLNQMSNRIPEYKSDIANIIEQIKHNVSVILGKIEETIRSMISDPNIIKIIDYIMLEIKNKIQMYTQIVEHQPTPTAPPTELKNPPGYIPPEEQVEEEPVTEESYIDEEIPEEPVVEEQPLQPMAPVMKNPQPEVARPQNIWEDTQSVNRFIHQLPENLRIPMIDLYSLYTNAVHYAGLLAHLQKIGDISDEFKISLGIDKIIFSIRDRIKTIKSILKGGISENTIVYPQIPLENMVSIISEFVERVVPSAISMLEDRDAIAKNMGSVAKELKSKYNEISGDLENISRDPQNEDYDLLSHIVACRIYSEFVVRLAKNDMSKKFLKEIDGYIYYFLSRFYSYCKIDQEKCLELSIYIQAIENMLSNIVNYISESDIKKDIYSEILNAILEASYLFYDAI